MIDQSIDLTETPQDRRHQQACKGPVPGGEACHPLVFIDGIVQRTLSAEHGTEKVNGDTPSRRSVLHGSKKFGQERNQKEGYCDIPARTAR
jgi:hypothetical protein